MKSLKYLGFLAWGSKNSGRFGTSAFVNNVPGLLASRADVSKVTRGCACWTLLVIPPDTRFLLFRGSIRRGASRAFHFRFGAEKGSTVIGKVWLFPMREIVEVGDWKVPPSSGFGPHLSIKEDDPIVDRGVVTGEGLDNIGFILLQFSSLMGENMNGGVQGLSPHKDPVSKGLDGLCRLWISELKLDVISDGLSLSIVMGDRVDACDDLIEIDGLTFDKRKPFWLREWDMMSGIKEGWKDVFGINGEIDEHLAGLLELWGELWFMNNIIDDPWKMCFVNLLFLSMSFQLFGLASLSLRSILLKRLFFLLVGSSKDLASRIDLS
jgi:hypothetical protein